MSCWAERNDRNSFQSGIDLLKFFNEMLPTATSLLSPNLLNLFVNVFQVYWLPSVVYREAETLTAHHQLSTTSTPRTEDD